MSLTRNRILPMILAIFGLTLSGFGLAATASAAPAGHGSNEYEVVAPPPLETCDGQQWNGFTGTPLNHSIETRLIQKNDWPGSILTYTIPGLTLPAGTVTVQELLLWDGYENRITSPKTTSG